MIATIAAVLLCSIASAARPAPGPGASPALAVRASTAAAASAADALGVSTYTVETLYTGDKVRDPFLPPSTGGGGPARPRDRNAAVVVDIHALELHGIMKDEYSDFAIFSTDTGTTLILRGKRLYDEHNKRVPGITGRVMLKQKRAELVTADNDVQIYTLGESDTDKAKDPEPDGAGDTEETGSGRSP